MRIGVFGGTFDPLHVGHLAAAQDVLESLSLDRVLLVPAGRSPHKPGGRLTAGALRLRMVREAVASDPRFEVSDLELRREGPSYTVDTLAELTRQRPGASLVLIVGADQWAGFGRWHRPREIVRLADLAVMSRDGEHPGDLDPGFDDGPPPPFLEVPVVRFDLSATQVRRRVQEGRSIRYLVPEGVRRIIEAQKLYLLDPGRPPEA